jgi:RNA polymerase sigma factor (sigma-70 family)
MTTPAEREPARDSPEHVRELVARGQEGDRDALEELYLIHFDRIYSYLHVSVGNRHDAEDLTTQTFLKMLEKIGSFKWQSAPFSAWLFRIAHNLGMDHFRARRRAQGNADDRPRVDAEAHRSPLA